MQVLRAGGNAVDAAITSTLCIGTMNMFSSGIGGGGFMIVRNPVRCSSGNAEPGISSCAEHVTVDFREMAPAKANMTMFYGDPRKSKFGGLAVGVPGEVAGLEAVWKRFGSKKPGLMWADLIEPVARLAEEGWLMSTELDRRLRLMTEYTGDFITRQPEWAAVFADPHTKELKREGDLVKRPSYGRTLREIGKKGSDAFYYVRCNLQRNVFVPLADSLLEQGSMAKSMSAAAQKQGGVIDPSDFAEYEVKIKPALKGDWLGRRVWTTQAPTSGPILLSVLRILGQFSDFVSRPMHEDVLTAHRFIEASKFGAGQRTQLGDPAFLSRKALRNIHKIESSEEESTRLFRKIDDEATHAELDYYEPLFDLRDDHGTMSLSVADTNGMAVALTSTVNLPFGSQVMDPESGVILNDELDDSSTPGVPNAFGLYPSPYNYPEPFKRPLSSMAPAIVERRDGSFLIAIGGSGGSRIYGSVLQTLLNLDWGMDISDAIEHPRLHHQLLPTALSAETGYNVGVVQALKNQKGHNYTWTPINDAVAEIQAVMHLNFGRHSVFHAASDSRKQGVAAAW